jgi:hypothetical protein
MKVSLIACVYNCHSEVHFKLVEVFTALSIRIMVFWNDTPCNLIDIYQHFVLKALSSCEMFVLPCYMMSHPRISIYCTFKKLL